MVCKILQSDIYGFEMYFFTFGRHHRKCNIIAIKVHVVMVVIFEFTCPL